MTTGRNDPCPCSSGKKYKHCCERKAQARPILPAPGLNQLSVLFASGQFAAAQEHAQTLLEQFPDEPAVWKLLAMSLQMQGKDGLPAFVRTAELLPNDAGAQMNLGNALQDAGRLEESIQGYQCAVHLKPNFAEAWNNLGSAFTALGQLEQARFSYQRAIQVNPNFALAHSGLAGVLSRLGQSQEAIAAYQRAIKLQPDYTEAYNDLGVLMRNLGQVAQAIIHYRQALKLQPDCVETHSNLGVALRDLGQFQEALISFDHALALNPNDAETFSSRGLTLHDMGKPEEAIASFNKALSIRPDYAEAHNNLGLSLHLLGRYTEAAASCHQAIALRPAFAEAHNNLGNALNDSGQIDSAIRSYRQAIQINPGFTEAYSNLLMVSHYTTTTAPSDYLADSLHYGELVSRKVTSRFTKWSCDPEPSCLKVGILSADLHGHPVGYFLESFLAQLDRTRIALFAYSNNPLEDALTARIKPYFSQWRPVFGLNDQAAAQLIHNDGIHVLLDLSGHTAHNRLPVLAWKPAPVQCTWLGYFASTGVAEIDFLLADATGVPEGQRRQFSETIWYLPDTRLCFTPPVMDSAVAPLPALANEYVTFGCFQNLAKLGDAVLSVWSRILAALPLAQLRLACKQLGDASVMNTLQHRLQHHGIDTTRVSLYGPMSRSDYLAAHAEVDMLLDTFPYPGGTTTCEGLWMGVPTVTLTGNTLLSRQGASLLTAAGLSDWVANDEDDYVSKAVQFASDLPKLAALRATLREQVRVSPLFDAPRFARHFEQALWGMWQAKMHVSSIQSRATDPERSS